MNITTTNGVRSLGVPILITLIVLSIIGFNALAASTTTGRVPKWLVDAAEYPREAIVCRHDFGRLLKSRNLDGREPL